MLTSLSLYLLGLDKTDLTFKYKSSILLFLNIIAPSVLLHTSDAMLGIPIERASPTDIP